MIDILQGPSSFVSFQCLSLVASIIIELTVSVLLGCLWNRSVPERQEAVEESDLLGSAMCCT